MELAHTFAAAAAAAAAPAAQAVAAAIGRPARHLQDVLQVQLLPCCAAPNHSTDTQQFPVSIIAT